MNKSTASFAICLEYIVGNTSHTQAKGRVYCIGEDAIGIASWSDGNSKETGLIPAERINRFLNDVKDGEYTGVGVTGFNLKSLIDPAMRGYLKMPGRHGPRRVCQQSFLIWGPAAAS